MAHGQNAAKNGHHREYWSRRPGPPEGGWGRTYKQITHRMERAETRRDEQRILMNPEIHDLT